jgi:hypothetical protein
VTGLAVEDLEIRRREPAHRLSVLAHHIDRNLHLDDIGRIGEHLVGALSLCRTNERRRESDGAEKENRYEQVFTSHGAGLRL